MDISDLSACIRKSLSHAEKTLRWLHEDPQRWDESVSNHPGVCLLEKVHSEVSLFGLVCIRLPSHIRCCEIDLMLEALALAMESPERRARSLSRVMRMPHLSPAFALPVLFRQEVLAESSFAGTLIRRALQHGLVEGIERYPFRRLDVGWVKDQFGIPNQRRNETLIQSTCLAMPVHPIYASLTDIYALTHAFMYDTDFGRDAPSSAYRLPDVARGLHAAASFAISEGDPDVLCEIVLCAWCMPTPPLWTIPLTEVVLQLWEQFGFVPPPQFEVSLLAMTGDDAEREAYSLRSSYHATLVGGVLAAVAAYRLSSPGAAFDMETSEGPRLGPATSALQLLDRVGCRATPLGRKLLDLVGSMSVRHPVLNCALADAAMIQSCRKYDLDVLLDALYEFAPHSASSACFDEALAFFRDQEVDAGLYGAHFLIESNRRHRSADGIRKSVAMRMKEIAGRRFADLSEQGKRQRCDASARGTTGRHRSLPS